MLKLIKINKLEKKKIVIADLQTKINIHLSQ
jgi:hypothetical protein